MICLDPPDGNTNFTPKGQHLKLKVSNNVISHDVQCSFVPEWEKYNLPVPLRCTGGNFNEITLDVSWTGSAPDFTLKIEQLWYCLENPKTNVNPYVPPILPSRCLFFSSNRTLHVALSYVIFGLFYSMRAETLTLHTEPPS